MKNFNGVFFYGLIFFAVLGLGLTVFDPFNVYAHNGDIEHGPNYDKELIQVNADGSKVYQWTSHYPRILEGQDYEDYIFNDMPGALIVETQYGSVTLDKSSCGFSFHKAGYLNDNPNPLFTDNIIARMATVDTDTWTKIDVLNNAECLTSWNGQELTGSKLKENVGLLEYKYILNNGKWKTQLEATNYSNSTTNKKFGFTQTIDLNKDTISYGGSKKNLDNFDGQTFDRNWIENNDSKLIQFLNGVNFDFDLSLDNLWSISVYDTGANSSKLSFDFTNNASVLLPGITLVIDPTYAYTTSTDFITATAKGVTGASCGVPNSVYDNGAQVTTFFRDSDFATDFSCYASSYTWDITSITAPAIIQDVKVRFDVISASGAETCEVYQIDGADPRTYTVDNGVASPQNADSVLLWDDIHDGNLYISGSTDCQAVANDYVWQLPASANTDLANQLNDDWFSIGIHGTDETRNSSTSDSTDFGTIELQVIYIEAGLPGIPTGLTSTAEPYLINGTWTGCSYDGANDNTCTLITGVSVYNTTDVKYAGMTLPDNAGQDTEYSSMDGSISFSNNEILYHFDEVIDNTTFQDTSGSNNNATSFGVSEPISPAPNLFFDYSDANGVTNLGSGGSGLDGTNNGPADTSQPSIRDESYYFTIADYISIGDTTTFKWLHDGSTDWTFSGWMNWDTMGISEAIFATNNVSGSQYGVLMMKYSDSNFRMYLQQGGATDTFIFTNSVSMNTNQWYNLAFTYDASADTMCMYIDGDLIDCDTQTIGTTSANSRAPLWFSGDAVSPGSYDMNGEFDDFAFWQGTILTDEEITQLYGGGNSMDILLGSGVPASIGTGLIGSSSTGFPLNFTSTDVLFEGTASSQVGGLVNLASSENFNLFSFNDTSDNLIEIGLNETKQYVKYNGNDLATVDNDCDLNKWCFYSLDRSGNTFSFYQNDTLKGTGSSSQDFGNAKNNMFYIGYNNTIPSQTLSVSVDEYYINDDSDTSNVLRFGERGLNSMTWLSNTGNQTHASCPAGIEQTVYCRVTLTNGANNGTASDLFYGTSDGLPDAPSLVAQAVGETQIDVTRTGGASDGGDTVSHWDLRAEINGAGGWSTLITNSTSLSFYNHTGLASEDTVIYQGRDRNGVGYSGWSSNATSQTYSDIVASLTIDVGNVGDVINATGTLNVSAGGPLPITITLLELIANGTIIETSTPSDSFNIETRNITPIWFPVNDNDMRVMTLNATITNGIETIEIASSNNNEVTREYDPIYFPADTSGAGNLNYTITRNVNDMTLKMNRDLGGTWKAECLYADLGQALGGEGAGSWDNQTVIGYYQSDTDTGNGETMYIACYNDELLFTTVSYSNSSNALVLGLSIFDDLGGLFGAPAVMLIILAIATMATGRTAPTILVVLLTVIGIVGALGMLVLETEVWGLLVVAGAIGIFQIRRLF